MEDQKFIERICHMKELKILTNEKCLVMVCVQYYRE